MKKIVMNYSRKQTTVLILATALLISLTIVGVIAFLTENTDTLTNTFVPAKVTCSVEETVVDNKKSSVMIKNTGDVDAYIRVAVVANTVNADGHVIGNPEDMANYLATDSWTQGEDGYYYYNQRVQAGDSTAELLKNEISLEELSVTILAEAIQADGMQGVYEAKEAFIYAAENGTIGGGGS